MKVLYVATRGEGATTISVDLEISKLERLFSGSAATFSSISSITANEMPIEFSRRRFDVLHITTHGEGHALQALTDLGGTVLATAKQLAAYLSSRQRPRLVYLNACDSEPVAKQLVSKSVGTPVTFAVGNSAPVASDYSIHAALTFYGRLLIGESLYNATNVAHNLLDSLSSGRVGLFLHAAKGENAKLSILEPEPELLAAIPKGLRKGRSEVEIVFGIRGVPEGTTQVVFFSDDEDLIESSENDTLGGQLCAIARGRPTDGRAMWCDRSESWDVLGDFRLYAVGVTAEGRRWTAQSTLCSALRLWYVGLDEGGTSVLRRSDFDAALSLLEGWIEPSLRTPRKGKLS